MKKMKRRNKQIQVRKFSKWCKRVCQRIRSIHSFSTHTALQLHFLRNPQKDKPGLCIEYTTEKIFSIAANGQVEEVGRVFVEGNNEGIIADILRDDYDLM